MYICTSKKPEISNTYKKNSSLSSYYHKTDLGVWTYSDDELVFTPFRKEVVR